ncbi:MAG: hypothetical protein ACOC9P_00745 [bacterium]
MRAIASTCALAQRTGKRVKVVWVVRRELGAPYEALFEPRDAFRVRSVRATGTFGERTWAKLHRPNPRANRPMKAALRAARGFLFDAVYEPEALGTDVDGRNAWLEGAIGPATTAMFISGHYFYNPGDVTVAGFTPVAPLRAVLDELTAPFDEHTVGVHIRRTDNVRAIEASPLERFIEAIDEEIDRHAQAKFFLATDCAQTEATLRTRYGDRLIAYDKDRSRKTTQGVQDAVIDLYALARTAKVFGSHWSSFTDSAAQIGGIPLFTMRNPEAAAEHA